MAWIWVSAPHGQPADGHPVPLSVEGYGIGREADNGLVLADSGVSRHHARIFHDGAGWVLQDLGSGNGTWVGPERVQTRRLQPGEVFRLGDTCLVVVEEAAVITPQPDPGPPALLQPPGLIPPSLPAVAPASRRRRWPILLLPPLALLILALIAAVFLIAESGTPQLLSSQLASIWNNGWSGRLKPFQLPDTGVPAVDVEPVPGLRIHAVKGALDKPRRFSAQALSRLESRQLLEQVQASELIPLGGFRVDAGMGAEDSFAKPVQFSFDLERMKIPKELHAGLQVIRIEDSGRMERLPVKLEGRHAVVEARHNAGFVLAWGPLGIIMALMVAPLWSQYEKGAFDRHWWDDIDPYWHVCWPKAMKYRETPEVLRVAGILQERRKFHFEGPAVQQPGLDPEEYKLQRLAGYLKDPQVKACEKLTADVEWKIQHLYPAEVAYTVTALRHAGEYLWDVRKFRKRSGRIEVWVQQPWSHGTEYALTIDNATTYPYIQVNADKLPAKYPAPGGLRKDVDSLETTMVHEVFHVIQKEYFNTTKYLNPGHLIPGGARYEWFNEATAPMLEEEAEAHYKAKGWVTTWESTFQEFQKYGESVWGHLRLPLDDTGADESGTRKKGYAASKFLLQLRDTYYAADKNAFLPKLMETYCSFWTGPVEALVKSTSGSRGTFGLDYLAFCEKNVVYITCNDPNPATLSLSRQVPLGSWSATGPLSSPALRVSWPSVPAEDLKRAKLLVRPPKGLGDRIAHSWAWSAEPRRAAGFEIAKPGPLVRDIKGPGMMLQRVEYDADGPKGQGPSDVKPGAASDSATSALLLLAPKDPPRIRMNEDKKSLHIEIPESPLWRAGEAMEYRVRFYGPLSKDKPLPVSLGRGKREADVDLAQLMGTQLADPKSGIMLKKVMQVVSQQDLKDMIAVSEFIQSVQGIKNEMRVTYTEVLRSEPGLADDRGIEGPESPVFKVPAEAQPGDLNFGLGGTWRGQIMLVHEPVTLRTGTPGTVSIGTEVTYFRVTGSAQFGGYALEYLAKERDRYLPTGITVYAYRLPGRKLWLTIPPSVLYPEGAAKEDEPGWWEYFFGKKAKK